jgi:predicted alpha/beta-hydrolase family hydrolase
VVALIERALTMTPVTALDIETQYGPARAHLHAGSGRRVALVLGHGAAGGIEAPDLVAATQAGLEAGLTVVLVEQPYRVAGRRSPSRAPQLDAAWISIVEALHADELRGLQLIVGGRSLGARVACRTAEATAAVAVVCLAFPLNPPRRAGKPQQSRLPELDAVTLPTLVVQGERDAFGIPPAGTGRKVVKVPGDHSLKADPQAVATAVGTWLPSVVADAAHAT